MVRPRDAIDWGQTLRSESNSNSEYLATCSDWLVAEMLKSAARGGEEWIWALAIRYFSLPVRPLE